MQNKIISLTTTQALACMTPTLTPDPNSNPNSGHVSHTYVPLFTKQYKLVSAKGRCKGRYGLCVGGR